MKFSLITVTFNSGQTLRCTLDSVLKQTYKNIEYILVDGLSHDNTIDLIKEYEHYSKDACIGFLRKMRDYMMQ